MYMKRCIYQVWQNVTCLIMLIFSLDVKILPETLCIADHDGAIALAGIMGGLDSAVQSGTTDIYRKMINHQKKNNKYHQNNDKILQKRKIYKT